MAIRGSSFVPGQTPGTTTNDNAAAGNVGQYIESVVVSGSAVAATSATQVNVTSISLTAGDWDIEASITTIPAGGTTQSVLIGGISATTATLPAVELRTYAQPAINAGTNCSISFPRTRVSIASTTTYFLVADIFFAVSTLGVCGFINARRVR